MILLVTAPVVSGFGTRLIERTFAAQNGGRSQIDHAPDGLRRIVELRLSQPDETAILDLGNARS